MEQLELFATDRWPRRPYCTDDLKKGLRIRSLKQAINRPYIQANPPHLRVWSIYDVDYPGGGLAWEDENLPIPTWSAVNRENNHAHLVWGLVAPVLVDSPDMRQKPLRYLCAIESYYREVLKADHGYSGLITKNPAHPMWWVLRGPGVYTMDELAARMDNDIQLHLPRRRKPEEVGLGRNVACFEHLRHYAYRAVRQWKGEVRNFVHWQKHLYDKALVRNGDFTTPMDSREVWAITRSVSKWVWRRFDAEGFRQWSIRRGSYGGKIGGKIGMRSRWGDNSEKMVSARLLRAQGMRVVEIAEQLGVHRDTIYSWLSDKAISDNSPRGLALVAP